MNSPFLRGIGRGEDSRGHPLGWRRGGVPEVREAGENHGKSAKSMGNFERHWHGISMISLAM